MSDTPRTDAVANKAWISADKQVEQVPADFASTLERELNEQIKATTRYAEINGALELDRDHWKQRAEKAEAMFDRITKSSVETMYKAVMKGEAK